VVDRWLQSVFTLHARRGYEKKRDDGTNGNNEIDGKLL
jgi:hypothetical protein